MATCTYTVIIQCIFLPTTRNKNIIIPAPIIINPGTRNDHDLDNNNVNTLYCH